MHCGKVGRISRTILELLTCYCQIRWSIHFKVLYISSHSCNILELYKSLAVPFKDVWTTPVINSHGQESIFADFKRLNIKCFHCWYSLKRNKHISIPFEDWRVVRARITSHGKIHVFSNDEMLPFASEGYFEDLETTEPWERKTEKQN